VVHSAMVLAFFCFNPFVLPPWVFQQYKIDSAAFLLFLLFEFTGLSILGSLRWGVKDWDFNGD